MKTIETQLPEFGDKSKWGDGPWVNEPDKKQWQDEETGLPCLIHRNRLGALCGYVGVPAGHPWFEKDFLDIYPEVHGGLTYSGFCAAHICHVVEDGEDDHVWWLGFDCAHGYDLCPNVRLPDDDVVYRTWEYAEEECRKLAKQAAAHGKT